MKCPSCGLENPPTAQKCDCGYKYETHVEIKRKKKRNPFLAAIATFGVFGLGQLYNGKPRKAAIAYGLLWVIAIFAMVAPFSANIKWLIAFFALTSILGLTLIIDAVRDARAKGEIVLHWYNRWYVYLTIIIIQAFIINPFQVKLLKLSTAAYKMPSGSMSPTIEIGDKLVADMKAYKMESPKRGDLLIFKYPNDESVQYLKRLIGLPGEKVEIIGRKVYVNDQPLAESYVQFIDPASTDGHFGPVQVPQNQYFVLGDNRDNSQDSRFWGYIKRDQILGQVRYLYWAKDRSRIGKNIK
jgi:signal peptidase I